MLANRPAYSYSKEMQLYSNQVKPTQKQLGAIRNSVRKKVNNRAPYCEGCGINRQSAMSLENAHVDGRRQIDHMTTENDLLRLCGPSTQSGTCHHWVTVTKVGRRYMREQRERLIQGLKPLKVAEWKRLNNVG